MIDPSGREAMLRQVLDEPDVAVVLMDVVLRHGAHPDPWSRRAAWSPRPTPAGRTRPQPWCGATPTWRRTLRTQLRASVSPDGRPLLLAVSGGHCFQDMTAWYAAADAFAFPSVKEGFGLAVLEAMSVGVPVGDVRARLVSAGVTAPQALSTWQM